jgi:hypothetical protein
MIHTTATINIKSINITHDKEGSLIAFGIAEFNTRSREGVVADEIPFRSKGAPAVIIKERGEGIYGTAEGFIDLLVNDKGNYKEKLATLVIRNFVSLEPIAGETVQATTSKPETPDFAQEMLEENINSDEEGYDEQPPF